MNEIQWSKKLSVHVTEIDEQHQMLFDILNRAVVALEPMADETILQGLLQELTEYGSFHFTTEEQYFKEFQYTWEQQHIDQHRLFIGKIGKLRESLKSKDFTGCSTQILGMLDWLVHHLKTDDQKFGVFMRENSLHQFLKSTSKNSH